MTNLWPDTKTGSDDEAKRLIRGLEGIGGTQCLIHHHNKDLDQKGAGYAAGSAVFVHPSDR